MRRVFLLVVLFGALLIVLGALGLGLFPPAPRQQTVQHVIPNDRFGPH